MKREIKFNSFYSSNNYTKNLEKLFADYELFRQKHFSNECIELLKEDYPNSEIPLTHSATGALEMVALSLDIQEGDEIILPSFTFVSTASAFALKGAKLVFVDIEMDTLGINPELVKGAITEKTKAIVCVHYAIDELVSIAKAHQYFEQLKELSNIGIGLFSESKIENNYHEFYMISRSQAERVQLIKVLKENGIEAMFHYIPLQSSAYGSKFKYFMKNKQTDLVSARLLRLSLHQNMDADNVDYIASLIHKFYKNA
ncbi:MAG: dTDP-4-amino-4,6-dideoxygalactose transaminase [Chitinophagales bacterium]|jgi:dTDP-4-amino-4,6-dideoxygalactose transaminase